MLTSLVACNVSQRHHRHLCIVKVHTVDMLCRSAALWLFTRKASYGLIQTASTHSANGMTIQLSLSAQRLNNL